MIAGESVPQDRGTNLPSALEPAPAALPRVIMISRRRMPQTTG